MLAVSRCEENRTVPSGGVLRYGPGLKAFPIVILVAWLVLFGSIRLAVDPSPARPGDRLFVLVTFVIPAIVLPWIVFLEAFGTRVGLGREGIQIQSIWRGVRLIRWEDVESIYYSSWLPGFVVKGHGTRLTLNEGLGDIGLFAEAVSAWVPPDKWVKAYDRLRILLPKGPYD